MEHNSIAYVLSGLALAVAFFGLLIPNRQLGKKISLIALISALVGIFAPFAGFYLLTGEVIALVIALVVSIFRGLANIRW